MRSKLVVVAACAALAAAVPALAATPTVKALVGPGFTISMTKPKKAGTYRVVVSDKSNIHNFHLIGPGVNVKTSVPAIGSKTFVVKLQKGKTYRFLCDPHPTTMKGSFKVPA
jgi:hypothetical protein